MVTFDVTVTTAGHSPTAVAVHTALIQWSQLPIGRKAYYPYVIQHLPDIRAANIWLNKKAPDKAVLALKEEVS